MIQISPCSGRGVLAVVDCFLDAVSVAIDAAESLRLRNGESCGMKDQSFKRTTG